MCVYIYTYIYIYIYIYIYVCLCCWCSKNCKKKCLHILDNHLHPWAQAILLGLGTKSWHCSLNLQRSLAVHSARRAWEHRELDVKSEAKGRKHIWNSGNYFHQQLTQVYMIAGYGWDEFKIEHLTIYQHKSAPNGPKAAKIKDAGRGRKQYTSVFMEMYGCSKKLKYGLWLHPSIQTFGRIRYGSV